MTSQERIERDGLIIRTVEPADFDAIWELHVEGLRDSGTWVGEAHRDPAWDADVRDPIAAYLERGGHFWVAAVADATGLIATAAVRRVDDLTADLKRMRVTAAHRRRGIGRILAGVAEDWCRRSGISRMVLDTTDRQQPAQRLYECLGYVRVRSRWLEPLDTYLRYYEKYL